MSSKGYKPFIIVAALLVAGLVGGAGLYGLNIPNGGGVYTPGDTDDILDDTNDSVPYDNSTAPDDTVPVIVVPDDDNTTVPDDDPVVIPDDPVIIDDPNDCVGKVASHTYNGRGNGTTPDFWLCEGVTIIRVTVDQRAEDGLDLAICSGERYADNGTWSDDEGAHIFHSSYGEWLIDPHIIGSYMGPYKGDLVIGVRGTEGNYDGAFQNIGYHWLEVRCNGTWTFTVEQPRDVKGGSLPRTMHSEVGKTNYAYSIYIPQGAVRFTLTYDGPEDDTNGIFPFLLSNDGTELGPVVGGFDHDVTDEQAIWSFGHCYYDNKGMGYCEPEPGVYWIEVHDCSGSGEWTLSAELV